MTNEESVEITPIPSVSHKQTYPKTSKRRKHYCIFCDTPVHNFARHLERQHSDEIQVQEFLFLNKNDPRRNQLINKLRKEGDFCSGEIIPVQSKEAINYLESTLSKNSCKLLPCIHCKGWCLETSYHIILYNDNS